MNIDKEIDVALAKQHKEITDRFHVRLADERKFGDIGRTVVRALRSKGVNLPASPTPGTDKICSRYAQMGKDFDTLMEAVKKDVILKSEWDRFCMVLRLSQEDKTDDE
jgi:hypothetical protein